MALGSCCFDNPILDKLAFVICTLITIGMFIGGILLVVDVYETQQLEDEQSFDHLGDCILTDIYLNKTCLDNQNCDNKYQYEWQIFDLDECEINDKFNYTIIEYSNENLDYIIGDTSDCYTDEKCTEIFLEKRENETNQTGKYIGAFILFASAICFILFLWGWVTSKNE